MWSTPQMKTITIGHRIVVKWSMVLQKNNMDPSSHSTNIIVFVVIPPDDPALFEGGRKACLSSMKHEERRQNAKNIIEDKVFKLT